MSSYFNHAWTNTLLEYKRKVTDKRVALRGELHRRVDDRDNIRSRVIVLNEDLSVIAKSAELIQVLVDDLSKKGISEMESMLTAAVSAAFVGRDYKIRINVDDRGKDKKAEFVLVKNGYESGLDCNGDGLSAILSFVARQFFVIRFGRARVLFMDEPMKELSPKFLAGIATFIRTLIDELGFVVLIITHARSQFLPIADKVYWVEDGGIVLDRTEEAKEGTLGDLQ